MEIPINAEVSCTDGVCGETTCVIVDPIGEQITHVVVQESHGGYTEHLSADKLALQRGSCVEAVGGHVGEVDELIIDPADGHITHMILRKGHFCGHTDVSIPVDQIDRIEADTIYLKLDKHARGQLPPLALRRH